MHYPIYFLSFILCFGITEAATKVIAHRGVSKEAPENTLSAFAIAPSLEVDGMEFDVHLTKDSVPIVVHDGMFGRTTDGAFLKHSTDLNLDEVKSLDAGSWYSQQYAGEKIPTLDEVIELNNGKLLLMVEIKKDNSTPQQIVEAVLNSLKKVEGPYVIGSFDPLIVEEVMKLAPEYPVLGIVEEASMFAKFESLSIKHLAIWYQLLSEPLIQELHAKGIEVWTFTVDNPALAYYLSTINIDGIITNNPRTIKQALSNTPETLSPKP